MSGESMPPPPLSRRRVLTAAVGAGAAVAVAGIAGSAAVPDGEVSDIGGPVVVHLRDLSSGALDVFSGTERRLVTDAALAQRIARAAATGM